MIILYKMVATTAVRLLLALLIIIDVEASASSSSWQQWSCDELTPNLCDLHVTSGSLTIKSIPVKYWRYTRASPSSSSGNSSSDDEFSHSIIAVHGGPGFPHSYLLPLKQLACRDDIAAEVIFYDQAGCGESIPVADSKTTKTAKKESREEFSVTTDHHPHLLDPTYYSEIELPALIDHWKLQRYHILGHSWGTILAQLFAFYYANMNTAYSTEEDEEAGHRYQQQQQTPSSLQSLILAGPVSDAKSYIAAQWNANETNDDDNGNNNNLASLPPFIQKRLHSLEEQRAYDTPEYEAIDEVLTTFFTMRTAPPPDCFTESANGTNKDIYVGMQGASEFTIGGVLGDLNLTSRLHEINVPVLLTHGKYDTMRPSTVKSIQDQLRVPSERVLFPHSGHVSMIDDPELMNDAVASFIRRVEMGNVGRLETIETTNPTITSSLSVEDEDDGEVSVAAAEEANINTEDEEEGTPMKKSGNGKSSFMWIKLIVTFVTGIVIGELKAGRRINGRNNNGYTTIA